MDRYEYKIIKRIRNDSKETKELNRLGSIGWKVISIRSKDIYLIREKREV